MSRKIFESRFYFIIIVLIFCFFTLTYELINRNKRKSLDVDFDYNGKKNYLKIINNKKKLINKLNFDVKKKYDNEITIRNLKEDIKDIKRKYNNQIKNNKRYKKNKKSKRKIDIFVRDNEYNKYNELKERDIRSVHDPLSPPDRRLPRHIYPSKKIKKNFNYPTRGYPDNYHMLGILSRESDEQLLKLFGRQIYPGSSQWEYYLLKNGLESVKIPIKKGNNLEIDNNELLDVPQFNISKGKFKVTLYKLDAPRYNPYIY